MAKRRTASQSRKVSRSRKAAPPVSDLASVARNVRVDPGVIQKPPGKWINGLNRKISFRAAVGGVFRDRWQAVLYFLPLATERADDDIEFVHQLRVSSRRLAAVLDVLADGFPDQERQTLVTLNHTIRRTCGRARDLDVQIEFLDQLLREAAPNEATGIVALREDVHQRRLKAQQKLRQQLLGLGWELHQAGEQVFLALESSDFPSNSTRKSWGKAATEILQRELTMIGDRREEDLRDMEELHQLRIDSKQLRYASELFAELFPPRFRDELYPRLQKLQDLLGRIHDAYDASEKIRQRQKKWKACGHGPASAHAEKSTWQALKPGLRRILKAYKTQSRQALDEFRNLWPDFAGRGFRQPLEKLLKAEGTAVRSRKRNVPSKGSVDKPSR